MKRIEKLKDEPLPHGVDKLETVKRLYQVECGISPATKNKNRRALATVQILDNTRDGYRNGK